MRQILGRFDGYSLRTLDEEDYKQLAEWIAADPAHADMLDPEFFMGQAINGNGELSEDPRVTVCALDDRKHTLMYIRLTRASRVQIQFPPEPVADGLGSLRKHRREIVNALTKGMAFLEVGLEHAGATEWIFDTEKPQLRSLVEKRMGFGSSPNEMVRLIPRLSSDQAPDNLLHSEEEA